MCVGTIAFVVAFLLPFFMEQSIAWYYPEERRWAYEVRPTGLALDFYGRLVHGVIASSIAVIAAIAICKRVKALGERLRFVLPAWTITAVIFGIGYFAWTLTYRVPAPQPLPSWYQPR
jgi:hypothetical protein